MSTADIRGPLGHHVRFREDAYPLWRDSFSDEDRAQMVKDDLLAGESVSLVLMAVVTFGLVLGAVSVFLTL